MKDRTVDNVQKCDSDINISSSQTYRSAKFAFHTGQECGMDEMKCGIDIKNCDLGSSCGDITSKCTAGECTNELLQSPENSSIINPVFHPQSPLVFFPVEK
jgi:hypothetical protein